MGMRRMHARCKEADERKRLGFRDRVVRPQPEALAEVRQNRGVLGERLPVVEAQRRHAPERMDLQIGFGALFALGEIDLLRCVLLAAFLEHDMSRHRACAGSEIQCHHGMTSCLDVGAIGLMPAPQSARAANAELVSRFRSSPYFAASSGANFGIKGTLANL